jgi:hypothetical protein
VRGAAARPRGGGDWRVATGSAECVLRGHRVRTERDRTRYPIQQQKVHSLIQTLISCAFPQPAFDVSKRKIVEVRAPAMDVYRLSIRFHVGKRRQDREDRVAAAGESRYATFHARAGPTMSVSSRSFLSRALTQSPVARLQQSSSARRRGARSSEQSASCRRRGARPLGRNVGHARRREA